MPIYEYECKSCAHRLEKLQRMNDPALTDCPACNQSELKRLVSAAAFRLKGSGWYETDFKKGDKKNLHESGNAGAGVAESDSSATKSSAKSSDTKSSAKETVKESAKGSAKESTKTASKKTDAA